MTSQPLSQAARDLLILCQKRETTQAVMVISALHAGLQQKRLIRIIPVTADTGRVVVTDAGRAQLAEAGKS